MASTWFTLSGCLGRADRSASRGYRWSVGGYLYALWLDRVEHDAAGEFLPANKATRIAWQFKASGAVNTQVELANGRVFFGCNGGSVYCLEEQTGALLWQRRVDQIEPRARKHFSTPLVHDGCV